ncbi:MAG: glycerol-3-phosphate acyltransferase 1 [Anaerolineae bacterium]|nr:MAG: glycerol-3-phosphate acyltransferase 1 [Anaerolineae bacterium]
MAWAIVALLAGSVPFSVIIARYALSVDLRRVGDGNPGATNVLRAGGLRWGGLALALDFLKGAVPVGLAHFVGDVQGATLVAVALAPVAGHAFSPWLRGRGGKAVAATFGIWAGLSFWYVPTMLGLLLAVGYTVLTVDGWAVMLALAGVGLHLLWFNPDPVWLAVLAGNLIIAGWKQRADLRHRPNLKPALVQRVARLTGGR